MKNGFTLVELSIVLVIIGILVGGILIGQSLISSAENLAFIKQIQQYDIVLSNFKTKYKSLPGDSNKFEPQGNNNGVIEQLANDDAYGFESAAVWKHITDARMLPEKEKYTEAGVGIIAGVNVPKAKVRATGNVGIVVGSCADGCLYPLANTYWISHFPRNMRNLWGGACTWTFPSLDTDPCGPSMSPMVVAQLDAKIDDGLPISGQVWAAAWNEWDTMYAAPENSDLGCHNGTRYWVETKELKCAVQMKVGFAVGQH